MADSIYSTVSKRSRMNGQNGWGGDTASEEVETVTMLLELPRGGPHFCWSGLCVPLDFAPISTIHFPNSVSKYLQISSSPDKDRWIDDRYGRLDVLPHSLTAHWAIPTIPYIAEYSALFTLGVVRISAPLSHAIPILFLLFSCVSIMKKKSLMIYLSAK